MKTVPRSRWRHVATLAIPVLLLAGCTGADHSIDLTEEAVAPMPSGDQIAVSAVDMAKAMLQAGFTDTQILQDGPAIQAALATSGGAQIRNGTLVVALFVVHGNSLFVATGTHGSFTLPLASAPRPA
jgi:hypothetical protein